MEDPKYMIQVDDILAAYWNKSSLVIDVKMRLRTGQDYQLWEKVSTLPLNYKKTTLKEITEEDK